MNQAGPQWTGHSILIVDDTVANLLAYSAVLKRLGCKIVLVRSGREALQSTLDQTFDLILMDQRMPELNGFETAMLLRQREGTRRTPILFMSAYEFPSVHLFSESLGPEVDFILSPVDAEVMVDKVVKALSRSRSQESACPSDPNLEKSGSASLKPRSNRRGPSEYGAKG
jgi:CheY-like chemotaxis protein